MVCLPPPPRVIEHHRWPARAKATGAATCAPSARARVRDGICSGARRRHPAPGPAHAGVRRRAAQPCGGQVRLPRPADGGRLVPHLRAQGTLHGVCACVCGCERAECRRRTRGGVVVCVRCVRVRHACSCNVPRVFPLLLLLLWARDAPSVSGQPTCCCFLRAAPHHAAPTPPLFPRRTPTASVRPPCRWTPRPALRTLRSPIPRCCRRRFRCGRHPTRARCVVLPCARGVGTTACPPPLECPVRALSVPRVPWGCAPSATRGVWTMCARRATSARVPTAGMCVWMCMCLCLATLSGRADSFSFVCWWCGCCGSRCGVGTVHCVQYHCMTWAEVSTGLASRLQRHRARAAAVGTPARTAAASNAPAPDVGSTPTPARASTARSPQSRRGAAGAVAAGPRSPSPTPATPAPAGGRPALPTAALAASPTLQQLASTHAARHTAWGQTARARSLPRSHTAPLLRAAGGDSPSRPGAAAAAGAPAPDAAGTASATAVRTGGTNGPTSQAGDGGGGGGDGSSGDGYSTPEEGPSVEMDEP